MPNAKLTIAAIIWLRLIAEAKQPSDMYSAPNKMIPKNVLPRIAGSRPARSLLKWCVIKMQASSGTQINV